MKIKGRNYHEKKLVSDRSTRDFNWSSATQG